VATTNPGNNSLDLPDGIADLIDEHGVIAEDFVACALTDHAEAIVAGKCDAETQERFENVANAVLDNVVGRLVPDPAEEAEAVRRRQRRVWFFEFKLEKFEISVALSTDDDRVVGLNIWGSEGSINPDVCQAAISAGRAKRDELIARKSKVERAADGDNE